MYVHPQADYKELIKEGKGMIKENICIGAAVAGCMVVVASCAVASWLLFFVGFMLMMGSMAMVA